MLETGGGSVLHRASVKLKPPPLSNEKEVEANEILVEPPPTITQCLGLREARSRRASSGPNRPSLRSISRMRWQDPQELLS